MNLPKPVSTTATPIKQAIAGSRITVLRLDLLDSLGCGNKIFKLRNNLDEARRQGFRRVASFGGAWSNHIHALAHVARDAGLASVGLIRGEATPELNPTLSEAQAAGMQLHFLSRSDYRRRTDGDFLAQLQQQFPDSYWIPEGGSNIEGVRGCMDIGAYVADDADCIVLPCGTAATLAGVAAACPDKRVLGIAVLKGAEYLEAQVRSYLQELRREGVIDTVPDNWSINHDWHHGGYARVTVQLAHFIQRFEQMHNIPVEPVYSGKMFFALEQLLQAGEVSPLAKVTAIHTGGLQGLRGMLPLLQRRQLTTVTDNCKL